MLDPRTQEPNYTPARCSSESGLRPLRDLFFPRPSQYPARPWPFCCSASAGSDRVDVSTWNGRRARIRCFTCNHETSLEGFTISEFEPAKLLAAALVDQARKHRKRSPEKSAKIQSERMGVRR